MTAFRTSSVDNHAVAMNSLDRADDALALMINCYELQNKAKGESHCNASLAFDTINCWLEQFEP
jgi:hypothetical protein